MACADGGAAPPDAVVQQLMAQDMPEVSGKEIRMLSVEYGSGAASLLHRHNAQVFVYVLEGAVRMQVEGKAALTLNPGETFYEDPGRVVRVIGSLI
jgi:quercetin dioxygenase-like cupin family protein